jgi:hypothetical protein
MSYPAGPPRAYQIDVVDQVGRAYRAVFERLQLVGEMVLLPYVLVLAIEFVAALIAQGGMVGRIVAALVQAIGFLLFGTVFVVRWQRFVLLGETVGGELLPPGWREFVIVSVKLGALVFVGWLLLFGIALLPPFFVTIPLTAAGGVALTLAALRLSLIFPAAAIGRPIPLRAAWDSVAGNFWRLFGCAFAAYFPFVVLQMVVAAIGSGSPSLIGVVFLALRLALSFAGSAVAAALLCNLYRDLGIGEYAPATLAAG